MRFLVTAAFIVCEFSWLNSTAKDEKSGATLKCRPRGIHLTIFRCFCVVVFGCYDLFSVLVASICLHNAHRSSQKFFHFLSLFVLFCCCEFMASTWQKPENIYDNNRRPDIAKRRARIEDQQVHSWEGGRGAAVWNHKTRKRTTMKWRKIKSFFLLCCTEGNLVRIHIFKSHSCLSNTLLFLSTLMHASLPALEHSSPCSIHVTTRSSLQSLEQQQKSIVGDS